MEQEKIIVREAVPSDAPQIAGLIVQAWPIDAFVSMGKGKTVDDLISLVEELVARPGTIYSYENTVLAAAGSEVVGIIVGYDGADLHRLRRPVEETFALRFGASDTKWDDETAPGEFYFDSAAVAPSMRGHGIGSLLFDAMLTRCRAMGHKVAGLLVDVDNPSAERLYQRLGFSHVGDKIFMGHSMKHMQKQL